MKSLSNTVSQRFSIRRAAWMVATPLALAAQLAMAGGDIGFTADTVYPAGVAWSAQQQAFSRQFRLRS